MKHTFADDFCIAKPGTTASLIVDIQDYKGVVRAATDLQADIEKVAGIKPELSNVLPKRRQFAIIIGTLGKSKYISQLIRTKKISVNLIRNQWEAFSMNLDQKLGKRISMGGSVFFNYLDYDGGKGIATWESPLGTPYNSPNGDVTQPGDPASGLILHPCGEPLQYNPFYDLTGVTNQNHINNINITYYMKQQVN